MKERKTIPPPFWAVLCIDYSLILAGGLLFRGGAPLQLFLGFWVLPGFSLLHWLSAKKYWHFLIFQCNLAATNMASAVLSGHLYSLFVDDYLAMAISELWGFLGWIYLFLISLVMTVIWFVRHRKRQTARQIEI